MYHIPSSITLDGLDSKDKMALFSLNCQSLKGHWDKIKDLIYEITVSGLQLDIIGLTEVFKTPENLKFDLEGFRPLLTKTRPDARDNRGGVGMYINEDISYIERTDLSIFIPHVIETLFVEITDKLTNQHSIIGTIYRPNTPPLANIQTFLLNLYEIIEKIAQEKKPCYLMGDFNIDLLKIKTDNKTKEFFDTMLTHGYIPQITKPTRITNQSATLIDNIFSNNIEQENNSGIIITSVADHYGILHIVKKRKLSSTPATREIRIFSKKNVQFLCDMLHNSDFSNVLGENNPNRAYDMYMETFNDCFNIAFPTKKVKLTRKYIKRSPWITDGILTSSIRKSRLLHKKAKKPTQHNIDSYKIYSKLYNKIIRAAKANYYSNTLNENINNTKETWKILNSAINRNKTKSKLPDFIHNNNNKITDEQDIANIFNKYFSNIGQNTSQTIQAPNSNYKDYLKGHYNKNFFLHPVIPEDLINLTKRLKNKFSAGEDLISTKLIKDTISCTAVPLAHIFNRTFVNGDIPNRLKIALFQSINKEAYII